MACNNLFIYSFVRVREQLATTSMSVSILFLRRGHQTALNDVLYSIVRSIITTLGDKIESIVIKNTFEILLLKYTKIQLTYALHDRCHKLKN